MSHPQISIRSHRTGRLAPSPTGALHLGNIRTFMLAWLQMRAIGGRIRLRIEDLDHPKHKQDADKALIDDLQWLGFDWDGDILWQTQRTDAYHAALEQLAPSLYPCTCTRADIQNAQSAPHPGDILRYPNHCRHRLGTTLFPKEPDNKTRPTAWRLALTPQDNGRFTDAFCGPWTHPASDTVGDFVVARQQEASYALAVVIDDAQMGITDILRGDDILPATPAQIVLYHRLGYPCPTFWHVPLVIGKDGRRLAKRHGDTRISTYRASGIPAGQILSTLARSCGWAITKPITTLPDLLPYFTLDTLPHQPFVWEDNLLISNC